MSQHRSLRGSSLQTVHRNVLKRNERVKIMAGRGDLEGRKSALKLPKIRSIKVKVKAGAKAAPKEEAKGGVPEQK